jgi:hypothetical protein
MTDGQATCRGELFERGGAPQVGNKHLLLPPLLPLGQTASRRPLKRLHSPVGLRDVRADSE